MSPSTCAICMLPIVKPQKILITGTEAVHRACAAVGGLTVRQRQSEVTLKAVALAERLQRELAIAEQQAASASKECLEAIGVMSKRHTAEMDTARAQRRELERQLQDADNERRRLGVELDAARAELAKRNAPEPKVEPTGDDAEVRFGLLELDPL